MKQKPTIAGRRAEAGAGEQGRVSSSGQRPMMSPDITSGGSSRTGDLLRDERQTHERMVAEDCASAGPRTESGKGEGIEKLMEVYAWVSTRRDLERRIESQDLDHVDEPEQPVEIPGSNWRRPAPLQDEYGKAEKKDDEGRRSHHIGWMSSETMEDRLEITETIGKLKDAMPEKSKIENARLLILAALSAVPRPLNPHLVFTSWQDACQQYGLMQTMTSSLISKAMHSLEEAGIVKLYNIENPQGINRKKSYMLTDSGDGLVRIFRSQEGTFRASAFGVFKTLFASEIPSP